MDYTARERLNGLLPIRRGAIHCVFAEGDIEARIINTSVLDVDETKQQKPR